MIGWWEKGILGFQVQQEIPIKVAFPSLPTIDMSSSSNNICDILFRCPALFLVQARFRVYHVFLGFPSLTFAYLRVSLTTFAFPACPSPISSCLWSLSSRVLAVALPMSLPSFLSLLVTFFGLPWPSFAFHHILSHSFPSGFAQLV